MGTATDVLEELARSFELRASSADAKRIASEVAGRTYDAERHDARREAYTIAALEARELARREVSP